MTNESVVKYWIDGKIGHSLNMDTDGNSLFSYQMKIGQTLTNGEKQGLNVQKPFFYSQTTSKHVGLVKRYADKMIEPKRITYAINDFGSGFWYLFP